MSGIFGSQKETFSTIGIQKVSASVNFTGDVTMAAEMLLNTNALCIMPKVLGNWSGLFKGARALPVAVTLPRRDVVLWCRRTERHHPDILDFLERLEDFISAEFSPTEYPQ